MNTLICLALGALILWCVYAAAKGGHLPPGNE